ARNERTALRGPGLERASRKWDRPLKVPCGGVHGPRTLRLAVEEELDAVGIRIDHDLHRLPRRPVGPVDGNDMNHGGPTRVPLALIEEKYGSSSKAGVADHAA